ncbi:hypothetical protein DYB26_005818 [Aphanomyces astaci]|uniref:Uncharacterized protein n=1 Tax=Aphanomyces astaci TaxID=112090 RepID=A0A397F7I9_APHAT|nr:hypothetical protein DYB26_005818 [Aphanomyces astaci]RHZ19063.1 hypothetical protein DYB31_003827 [Aphanomyces astaci]
MSQARHALVDEVEFLKTTLSEVNAEVAEGPGGPGFESTGLGYAQARLNDQQAELRDLASRLTAQTEKATELERRVQEAGQALEVMTAEVNDARDYTAHSARLVAGKEGVAKLALQNKSLVVAEMSDLRRSLEAERENSEKARQDRDRALTTAGELQEQLRVAQDRIAQPLRFSASNPAWDILLAENQDLREAAKTQKARAKDSRVRNKILRSQTETFQADALQTWKDLAQLEEKLLREKQASHDLEEKLQAFQESERTSARALLHANEHFQDAVPSFWDWVAQHLQVSGAAGVAPLIEAHLPRQSRARFDGAPAWASPGPDVQCLGEHGFPGHEGCTEGVFHAVVGSPGGGRCRLRDNDATYMAVGSSKPWEQYKAQESFIHSSWRRLPLWAELQEQLEDFWENHALAHWNRRFMRGSAKVNA